MEFPIYRKYKGIDVWFKITSQSTFTEYKKLGPKIMENAIEAKIFPEKQFIQDMINCYENRWESTTPKELEAFLSSII